ncbi:Diphthamide biosynthesis protein 1 [Orchesella cincta]|uniref:2-(3-amino-3-carboxypropyl)histidine synthase subunit 1 n=1 Tax=Orchesella cincta TaxID=48709 RepID=A0A1D2NHT8_ORCCI|nr:Diphthamide biosynthesis protein 1 [Orchesella cincta]
MMANPNTPAYRYDPYNTTLTYEEFNHSELNTKRQRAICSLQSSEAKTVGVVLGTLGRQGNPIPMEHVYDKLVSKQLNPFVVLMSEVMPAKLELFKTVTAWVQFCCPRLSIDWGTRSQCPC